MGSEHSNLGASSNIARQTSLNSASAGRSSTFKRQHTIANPGQGNSSEIVENVENRPRSISPGPSLCSDVDLPYISYTVNQPIGDSPKFVNRQGTKQKSVVRKITPKTPNKSVHNIVVVKPAAAATNIEKDPEIVRLQNIPMFLPIMRGTLHLPAARDPEIFERLDPSPFFKLCLKYENYLNSCATLVGSEQNSLSQKIKENDIEIAKLINVTNEKQKRFAKYSEKLSKVHELSHQLNRCHTLLNQLLESMETLNNSLSIEDRLEPFVWTTG